MNEITRILKTLDPDCRIYPESRHTLNGVDFLIARLLGSRKLVIVNDVRGLYPDFNGENLDIGQTKIRICNLDVGNSRQLRRIFPFANPSSLDGHAITIGLGDRLGLASPGHIRCLKGTGIFPVLAQQSIRELNLTGRNYQEVLAAAVWAVFQEGWQEGYGADGDHLKTAAEVRMALDEDFTMITLDCSEHIDNTISKLDELAIDLRYQSWDARERQSLESKYLDREFGIAPGYSVRFPAAELKKIILIYQEAVRFAIGIYHGLISKCGRPVSFEMSIDETLTTTTPESHFYVASELIAGGVTINSLAPRFVGEFQKGIDYRGDLADFTRDFQRHEQIARHLGYKISIHSGSDKFSVFPIIGEKTGGRYHLKTAGTNWLEAVRVIAAQAPGLYRRMHGFALEHLAEAKKYYHISADVTRVPALDTLADKELPGLMNQDDARQLLHITYGLLLQEKDAQGGYRFRDEIYAVLDRFEAEYSQALQAHIGRHLAALGAVQSGSRV